MQGFAPIMWSVWGAVVFALVALKVYSSRLSRDEDDHVILDDSFNHIRSEQAAIVEKVHKIEPIQKVIMWMAVAMTVVVLAYYAFDMFSQFK
jgi:heme exporter protein D